MNNFTKGVCAIALPILLIEFSPACFAQYHQIPVQQNIKTPYGNATITTYVPGGPMNYNYSSANPSRKYKFTVVLKNDSTFIVKSRIDYTGKRDFLKAKRNKKKIEITPEMTKEISRIAYPEMKMTGIPSDTCWLFLSIQGKISAYSFLAEKNSEYIIAAQKYSGPIVKITEASLKEMVEDHEKALKHIEKKRFKKAIEAYNERR